MALSEDDLNLLLNLIRHPWSSVGQMADVLQMTRQEIKINMQNLIERGYAQHITQSLQPYTKALYAPSNVGLRVAAQQVDISPEKLAKRLGCSSLRFWQLRAGLTVAREANLFCAVLARHMLQHGQAQTRWELFVERCHEHTPILIHARINVAFKNRTCTYYLLVDDGEHSIWMWWRHLRYFGLWSKRVSERFPPLLLLTTNEFRASALMLLAKQLAPTIVTVATADRDHVMGNVGFGEARWLKLIGSAKGSATYQAIPCHPFTTDLIVTESTLDEKHRVTVTSLASLKKRLRAGSKKHAQESATFDLERPPAQLSGMVNLEQCNNATYELLGFICHHPACPTSIIEGSLGCSLEELVANLQQLLELGLIQSNPLERDDQVIQLWAATEEGMLLRILRQVCPRPERYVARYLRTVADHLRRPDHTLAIYDFFERLQQHAQGWSRVTRAVDSSVTSVSEGRIPHYELELFEDDFSASVYFMHGGIKRRWLPDGYGVLRCGLHRFRFWLEIDGSKAGRHHNDPEVWERKLGGLCAYIATGKWRLRHPALPMLLIVTTDLRIFPLVADVLANVSHGYGVPIPQVFLTSADDVAEHGPLSPIWRATHDLSNANFIRAFPPLVA